MEFLVFKKVNKNLFLTFFGVAVLVLGFWALPAPEAKAACGGECYDDAGVCKTEETGTILLGTAYKVCTINTPQGYGLSILGTGSCLSGSGATQKHCRQDACNSTLNPALDGKPCDILVGTSSFGLCVNPTMNIANGGATGFWDESQKQCIQCLGIREEGVCGTVGGIYTNNTGFCETVDGGGNPLSSGWNKFDTACNAGVSLQCDEQSDGCLSDNSGFCSSTGLYTNCPLNNCVAPGACGASSLSVSADPNTVTQDVSASVEFTVLVGGAPFDGADVTAIGSGVNVSCTTNEAGISGKCSISFTATSAGFVDVKAVEPGYTDGTATITVNAAGACPGGFMVDFYSGSYSVGDQFKVNFSVGNPIETYGAHGGCVGLYNPSNTEVWSDTKGNGFYGNFTTGISASVGTWKLTIKADGACDINSACFATTTVNAVAGCTAGTCNGPQWCPVAGGAWANCPTVGDVCQAGVCAPVGPPNIHINAGGCPGCNPAGTGPCNNMQLNDLWTAASAPYNAATCAVDGNISTICAAEIAGGFNGCQINLSNDNACSCGAAAGPPIISSGCTNPADAFPITVNEEYDNLDNDTLVIFKPDGTEAACAILDGSGTEVFPNLIDENGVWTVRVYDEADCTTYSTLLGTPGTITVPCPEVIIPCGGPGMFVSPLSSGYCTIGEILTNATNWILSLVASIIILILVIGGLMYISSTGDEEKLRTSKNIILYAIIGLGIILISYALITEVTDLLKGP